MKTCIILVSLEMKICKENSVLLVAVEFLDRS